MILATMKSSIKKINNIKKAHLKSASKTVFWFSMGAVMALFLISSFSYIGFQKYYKNKIYPGITIDNVNFGSKSKEEVVKHIQEKNDKASNGVFVFKFDDEIATVSAKEIDFGYDENLLAEQAISIGRSKDPITNLSLIFQAYTIGINLSPAYRYSSEKLDKKLEPLIENINTKPVEAVFTFENGRVTEFKASSDGREVNKEELNNKLLSQAKAVLGSSLQKVVIIQIPIKILKPNLTTDKVNQMGIRELIGTGTSLYQHSIDSRIYNVALAASRVNGVLVAPGEIFSFAKAVGDVSSLTGYKQAYVISGGKTVLGDGGGVCQVSTTLFRAALNAGLPIVERHPHAYRVGYYEQDSPPGIDATVYVPSVDFKFKNDTGHHILIQTIVDPVELRLTFMFYGTSDGRISEVSSPVITNQVPAPEAKYEDDPSLPKGQIKQVDFAAPGAKSTFSRIVKRDGKIISEDTFVSNYRPWQAVFLRGTKE